MTNEQFAIKVAKRIYDKFELYEVSYGLGDMFGDYPNINSPNKKRFVNHIKEIIIEEINNYKNNIKGVK